MANFNLSHTGQEIDDAITKVKQSNLDGGVYDTVTALITHLQGLGENLPDIGTTFVTNGRATLGDSPSRTFVLKNGTHTNNGGTVRTINVSNYVEMVHWDGDVRDFATTDDAQAAEAAYTSTITKVNDLGVDNIIVSGTYNGYVPAARAATPTNGNVATVDENGDLVSSDTALTSVNNKAANDLSNVVNGSVTFDLLDSELQSSIGGELSPQNFQGNLNDLAFNLPNPINNINKYYFTTVSGALTGTNNNNQTVEDGGYLFSNGAVWRARAAAPTVLATNSVSEDHIDNDVTNKINDAYRKVQGVLETTNNLYDVNDTGNHIFDQFMNWVTSTGATLNFGGNVNFRVTPFIPVTANTTYYAPYRHSWAYFDINYNYISGSIETVSGVGAGNAPNDVTAGTVVVPNNASIKYVRFNIDESVADEALFYLTEGSSALDPFESYGGQLSSDALSTITASNFDDFSIPKDKCAFFAKGKNLFNTNDSTIIENSFSGANGVVTSNSTYFISHFIPVTASQTYRISSSGQSARFLTAYDSGFNVVQSAGSNSTISTFVTPASGVAYIKFTGFNATRSSYQFEQNTSITAFEAYNVSLDISSIKDGTITAAKLAPGAAVADGSVTTAKLADDAVTVEKADFLTVGKNLFNVNDSTVLDNHFMSHTTGNTTANSTYFVSHFIPVTASTQYFVSSSSNNARFVTFFDSSQAVVSGGVQNSGAFTTSSSTAFVKFSGYMASKSTYQFELGGAQTGFQAFGHVFDTTKILFDETTYASNWADKKFTSYGDSLTSQETWQSYAISDLGLAHTKLGVGGRRISGSSGMVTQANVDTIGTDCQLLHVLGGTNDWANNVTIGSPTSTNENEFYGALNVMAERLVRRLPNCRIVFGTIPNSAMGLPRPGWSVNVFEADGTTPVTTSGNSTGFSTNHGSGSTTEAYSDAIRTVADKHGFPVIDYAKESGINKFNLTTFMSDDASLIHPNTAGGRRMGEILTGRLRDIAPTN